MFAHAPGRMESPNFYTGWPVSYTHLDVYKRQGVHWEKPNLGFVDFEGSFENNLLFRYAHGTGVFLDKEETDPAKMCIRDRL